MEAHEWPAVTYGLLVGAVGTLIVLVLLLQCAVVDDLPGDAAVAGSEPHSCAIAPGVPPIILSIGPTPVRIARTTRAAASPRNARLRTLV